MPNVIASDIEFNPTLGKVYVSTFGRSIWAADLNTIVSVKNNTLKPADVKLYPTVNNGQFTLELTAASKDAQIQVIDVQGRVVHERKGAMATSNNFSLVLPSGVYYLKADVEQGSVVKQFIVE